MADEKGLMTRALDAYQRVLFKINETVGGKKSAQDIDQALSDMRSGDVQGYVGGIINGNVDAVKHIAGNVKHNLSHPGETLKRMPVAASPLIWAVGKVMGGEETSGPGGAAAAPTPAKPITQPQGMAKPENKTSR